MPDYKHKIPGAKVILRLVYISQTTKPFSTGELQSLLKECRRNNSKNGLTGVLLYYDECFVQVLESPGQTVQFFPDYSQFSASCSFQTLLLSI